MRDELSKICSELEETLSHVFSSFTLALFLGITHTQAIKLQTKHEQVNKIGSGR